MEPMANNHRLQAVQQLRELILCGTFAPGERITEAALAERLAISRTPIRQALPALCQEGLLVQAGNRGYAVRRFSQQESLDALAVRALMEGMAARAVAEQGASAALLATLHACLGEGDRILASRSLDADDEQAYGAMNARFHRAIVVAANKPILTETVDRCTVVPFVSPVNVVFGQRSPTLAYDDLYYGHRQHGAIVSAIEQRDGARAELLFREHANTQRHSMGI
ncbi:GntR family transcriptional regulator [Xanthomonas sp. NCPPB 2865]|uniref:GntR family transcriptional regulator n=2 Tax=Xanthomonas arboricola TaxID=56448 RepID=A0A7U7DHT3_XANCJ|nr:MULTISPECIES: GntR family transcriptional regulator [Xanthomonas]AKC80980.1 GntR family transcriptional regulator [Xanthomonas arboricola]AKU49531.1 GntR family transcriptional regulator [Xanthomonas arboricola pv. juglandis]KOA97334.1 GntR family transcriptional regulator [Xanthomonas arboricola]KOB03980.1 GntR family transcriptional regulator [Xanthomonas arboricola]KOB05726.1 GntR family transcriptional regulator [Xanthomonas arboricola]